MYQSNILFITILYAIYYVNCAIVDYRCFSHHDGKIQFSENYGKPCFYQRGIALNVPKEMNLINSEYQNFNSISNNGENDNLKLKSESLLDFNLKRIKRQLTESNKKTKKSHKSNKKIAPLQQLRVQDTTTNSTPLQKSTSEKTTAPVQESTTESYTTFTQTKEQQSTIFINEILSAEKGSTVDDLIAIESDEQVSTPDTEIVTESNEEITTTENVIFKEDSDEDSSTNEIVMFKEDSDEEFPTTEDNVIVTESEELDDHKDL